MPVHGSMFCAYLCMYRSGKCHRLAETKQRRLASDGILGHKFNKRLESFAPCYSKSLLLADFTENHTLLWFKNPYKKSTKQENPSLFMNSIL